MLSPVLITRSGSRAASPDTQRCRASAVGVMCRSEMCSTRSAGAPAGSTGTSTRRSRKALTSYRPAYASAPAPTALVAARTFDTGAAGRGVADIRRRLQAGPPARLVPCPPHRAPLKERLRADLTTAIKERDKVRSGTIRMVLSAISEAEVAGAEAIELSDQQVLDVVIREAKKRREAEEAYAAAGRDRAGREGARRVGGAGGLPAAAAERGGDQRHRRASAIAETGAAELGLRGMGKVMAHGHAADQGQGRRRRRGG